ncbi:MAG TPA: hypothetical protein VE753_07105 [Gaiellaceae bacterium]|jgi:hypothetical protein|nr:hypothetical protein [Gaiellaceae bacterium]
MSGYDIEQLARLIGMLPPAPEAWVQAAKELPGARRELSGIVARAEADAEFRARVVADLEAALRAEGVQPTRRLLDDLRRQLQD